MANNKIVRTLAPSSKETCLYIQDSVLSGIQRLKSPKECIDYAKLNIEQIHIK